MSKCIELNYKIKLQIPRLKTFNNWSNIKEDIFLRIDNTSNSGSVMRELKLANEPINRESTEQQISEVIESAIDSVRNSYIDNNVTIEYHSPKQENCVFTNHDKLTHILRKLLFFSVKFTDKNGKILVEQNVLKGKRHNDKADFIQIRIRSSRLELCKNIRDINLVNSQLSGDLPDSDFKGTPVYLLTSLKAIIKDFGGNFWVKSLPGNGMIFNITIPNIKLAR